MAESAAATIVQPATETPVTPPVEQPKQLSREYQIIVNREKALQRERVHLKSEKAAIEADKARIKEQEARFTKPKTPRELLERFGWSYKDATDYELNDGNPSAEAIARQTAQELQDLRRENEERDKKAEAASVDRATAEQQAVIAEFKTNCSNYCEQNKEKFELTNIFKAQDLVYDTVEEYFATHSKVLSIAEAAELVEKYCETLAEQYLASKKYQAKSATKSQENPKQPFESVGKTQQQRTLSNSVTSSTTPTFVSPKVEADRMRRALAALG